MARAKSRACQRRRDVPDPIKNKTSNDFGVPLPVTSEVFELFKTAMVKGRGELDHSGLLTVVEDMADIQARTADRG